MASRARKAGWAVCLLATAFSAALLVVNAVFAADLAGGGDRPIPIFVAGPQKSDLDSLKSIQVVASFDSSWKSFGYVYLIFAARYSEPIDESGDVAPIFTYLPKGAVRGESRTKGELSLDNQSPIVPFDWDYN